MKINLTETQCQLLQGLNKQLKAANDAGSGGGIVCQIFPAIDGSGGIMNCQFLDKSQIDAWWQAAGQPNPNDRRRLSGNKMFDASKREQMPVSGRTDILPSVIDDIKRRGDVGIKKYGTTLQSHNGRDALVDAYQEAIDLSMYLRQVIMERDGR